MGETVANTIRHNERTKLIAAALDKLALATIGAGFLVPLIQNTLPGNVHTAVTLFWLFLGVFFWGLAYGVLGRLV
jgi:hypothetical protein